MPDPYQITYFFILKKHTLFSPFAGFGDNIFWIGPELQNLPLFPASILELPWNSDERAKSRANIAFSFSILPVEIDALRIVGDRFGFFSVFIFESNLSAAVQEIVSKWQIKPYLMDSSLEKSNQVESVEEHLSTIAKMLVSRKQLKLPTGFWEKYSAKSTLPKKTISMIASNHFCTNPMIRTLESLNHEFISTTPMLPSKDANHYYDEIVKVADSLRLVGDSLREKNHKSRIWDIDLILCSQSLFDRQTIQDNFNELPQELRVASRIFEVQKEFIIEFDSEQMHDGSVNILGLVRRQEQAIHTGIMTLLCSIYMCPILRLPAAFQTDTRKEIVELLTTGLLKRGKVFNAFLRKMQSLFPIQYTNQFTKSRQMRIKIYSDSPVEFVVLPGRKLPLFLEHQVCRLPVTPGNVFLTTATSNDISIVSYQEICQVLIVRSFAEADPIKYHLEHACKTLFELFSDQEFAHLGPHEKRVQYEIVDVNSAEELRAILATRKPGILIFDCHGSHGTKYSNGYLILGKDKFTISEIDYPINLPNIVIFCACETYPLFPGHRSVANGFLLKGVKSIIGTNNKVGALHGAEFVARLLYRINDYFPAVFEYRQDAPITWLEFTSGLQQMLYATDILKFFRDQKSIDLNAYHHLNIQANIDINSCSVDWYETLCSGLSKQIGETEDSIHELIKKNINFSDAMYYVSIGNPDRIFVEMSS